MLNKEVIVIGAGLGGLFSAALLSKEGMKVTVIEKNRKPGGGMQSYNRKGAVFDTDMHVITSMFEGGSVYRLCRYLGILNDICIENVADGISDKIYVAEDNSVYNISAGREGFMQSLLHYFPDEEHDICAYVKALDAITDEMDLFLLRNSRQNVFVQNADFFMPVDQFISKYIHNLKLRRLLAYMNVLYAGDCRVTPAYLHAVIAVLLQKGVSRFKGGTYRFVEVLVRFIQAHGGTVITGEGVSDIIVEGDKVKYVKTDAGRVLSADVYISSIHPAVLLDLLSDRFAVSKSYYAQLQGTEDSCSAFILNIKLKKDSFPYMRYSSYYFESYESVWSANRKGVITKFMFLTPPVQDQGEYAHTLCITVPMDWNEDHWDMAAHEAYQKMSQLRKMNFFPYSAFSIEALDEDAFAIKRVSQSVAAVAIINKCARERTVTMSLFALPDGDVSVYYGNGRAHIENGSLVAELDKESSIVCLLTDHGLEKYS